jgi:hypothetical protein
VNSEIGMAVIKLKQSDSQAGSLCSELKELVGFYPIYFVGKSWMGL